MEGSAGAGGLTLGTAFGYLLALVALVVAPIYGGLLIVALLLRHLLPVRLGLVTTTVVTVSATFLIDPGVRVIAESAGRVPLPGCRKADRDETFGRLEPVSPLYCVFHRHYVTPQARAVVIDAARRFGVTEEGGMEPAGAMVRFLDAGLPLPLPLPPHISHGDGRKVDLALVYRDASGPVADSPSPIGYWHFEEPRPSDPRPCAGRGDWLTMRWDMRWLPLGDTALELDEVRTAKLVRLLTADPRVTKILLEPHLVTRLGVAHPKVRFQGCRAARHDDHIHIEVAPN